MGDLSKDFNLDEFRCKCCGKVIRQRRLFKALQDLRDIVGPVIILSGYRCPSHNAAVGGKEKSQHLLGTAADIVVRGLTPHGLAMAAEMIPAFREGGIGVYPKHGFVHVDVRKGKARWTW